MVPSDALRESPVVDGCRWLSVAEAVNPLREHWSAPGVAGRCWLNEGTPGGKHHQLWKYGGRVPTAPGADSGRRSMNDRQ